MKPYFIFLVLFLSGPILMADECSNRLINGSDQKFKAGGAGERAQALFAEAYQENHKDNPDLSVVCNSLDLSGEAFLSSLNYFNSCFDLYKAAISLCDADQLAEAKTGLNFCDEKAENAQVSLVAVNTVFAETCDQ